MESISELINLGKQYFDHKQYQKAEAYLRRVIAQSPEYADVLNMLGVINHIEGKFQAAMDYFRKALDINPRYTEALLNLTVLLNDLGEYQDAKKLYVQLKKRQPKAAHHIEPVLSGKLSNLHADIGDIYRSIGLYDLAIDEYRKALKLNPDYRDIRTKLAQAMRENGQLKESLVELNKVLSSNGRYTPAQTQIGVTYYAMGKTAEAMKAWRGALKQNAQDELAQMYLRLCEAQKMTVKKKKAVKKRPASKKGKRKKR